MRLILDEPKPIYELRKVYNDKVTFVTTVKAYPLVSAIEFSGDYHGALRKRKVPVRVGRKIDRAIEDYQEKLVGIWEKYQKKIQDILNFDDRETIDETEKSIVESDVEKLTRVTLAQVNQEQNSRRRFKLRQRYLEQQKEKLLKPQIDRMRRELQREAKSHFEQVFRIGKERAQVLTEQELDERLTTRDRRELKAKDSWNRGFVDRLTDDLWEEYEVVLGKKFDDPQDLIDALMRVDRKQKRRLPLFAAAVGSVLLAAGTTAAARAVREDPETGEVHPDPIPDPEDGMPIGTAFDGGIWHTRHDNRVCPGCEENDGKWLTHEQFHAEAGTNQCLTRCRCVELFEFDEKPTSGSKIWSGKPGASIRNWPRFKRSTPTGNIEKRLQEQSKSSTWETGTKRSFKFDPNSTTNEGRWRLYPPEKIKTDTYWRSKKAGKSSENVVGKIPTTDGVSYVRGQVDGKFVVQAVRFDKSKFTEDKAQQWWNKNKNRFSFYGG